MASINWQIVKEKIYQKGYAIISKLAFVNKLPTHLARWH